MLDSASFVLGYLLPMSPFTPPSSGNASITALTYLNGGMQSQGKKPQWVALTDVWRDETDSQRCVHVARMRLLYEVGRTLDEADKVSKRLPSGSVIRVEGKWAVEHDSPCIIVSKPPKIVKDAVLEAVPASQKTPIEIKHPALGKLRHIISEFGWTGSTKWEGKKVKLHITGDEFAQVYLMLVYASQVCADQTNWKEPIERAIASEVYDQYVAWSEGEALMSKEKFRKLIRLYTIEFAKPGAVRFVFSDGDTLGDHHIGLEFDIESRSLKSFDLL